MTTVFVTGGSGFIGGRLVRRLVEDGHTVRCLVRGDSSAAAVRASGAEPVRGDLSDVDSLTAACAGADLAFHAAARTERGAARSAFLAANVAGTRNVLDACRHRGVRRLVHVGTEAALMAGRALVGVDETAPLRPDSRAPYPASKAMAEQLVLDADSAALRTVVVRPRLVWGPGDTSVLPELVTAVRAGRFAWIGGGRQLTDTTHVDNVVHGLLLAAEHGRSGQAYFVTDGEPVVFREFVTAWLATAGVTAPDRSVPRWLATALTVAGERAWTWLRRPGAPPLDYFTLWASSQQCTIDIGKATGELGYRPVRGRAEGLAELAAAAAV